MSASHHPPGPDTPPATVRRPARSGAVPKALLLILGISLTTVPALACGDGGSTAEPRLTAGEFVAVVVALREAERGVANEDSAAALFAERKAEILSQHGTTEEELRSFLVAQGGDPEALRETWDTIAERLKHVPSDSLATTRRRLRLQ